MRVDVVIPVYNGAAWIRDAVRSVLDQTVAAEKIIVVDDGSTDDTISALGRFGSKIHVVRHSENRGLPAARNTGIRSGQSGLIAFLDADDVWARDKLERQLPEFGGNDPPGLSYTGVIDCDTALRPLRAARTFRRRVRERVFDELFVDAFPIPPSTAIVRRSVFDACGLFDESMLKAQDYEFWLRAAMKYSISCLPEPLCLRRTNPESITAKSGREMHLYYSFRAFELCAQAADRWGVALPMRVEERKILCVRRHYRDSVRWGDRDGEEFYRRKLIEAGAFSTREKIFGLAVRWLVRTKKLMR